MVEEEKRFQKYGLVDGLIVNKSKRCVTTPNAKDVPRYLVASAVLMSDMTSGIHIPLELSSGTNAIMLISSYPLRGRAAEDLTAR